MHEVSLPLNDIWIYYMIYSREKIFTVETFIPVPFSDPFYLSFSILFPLSKVLKGWHSSCSLRK